MSDRLAALTTTAALERSARLLAQRLTELEDRLQSGEEAIWSTYIEAVKALALVAPNLAPERRGELLTTGEMARRLGIAPKTLLKRKAKGEIRPAMQAGKLIRWRGTETV
jgi:DNA-binding transcriptional MerR regulator